VYTLLIESTIVNKNILTTPLFFNNELSLSAGRIVFHASKEASCREVYSKWCSNRVAKLTYLVQNAGIKL